MRRCDNGIPAFPKGERRLLNLPDCVFLTEQGRCRILRVPECTGETLPQPGLRRGRESALENAHERPG